MGLARVLSNSLLSLSTAARQALRSPGRILIVDHFRSRWDIGDVLSVLLRSAVIESAASAADALAAVRKRRPDLVFAAHSMPEMDGIALARQLKAQIDSPLVVVMTAGGSNSELEPACKPAGADFWVEKHQLQTLLEEAFVQQRFGLRSARRLA